MLWDGRSKALFHVPDQRKGLLKDLVQAGVTVSRLQWWLERWNDSEQREYRLSLSCGVAEYKPGRTIEDVIKAADADLYVEKANRGKVEALP